MNSRERMEMALQFEALDRPPLSATFVPEIEEQLRARLGIKEKSLGIALGNDLVKSCAGLERSFYGAPAPEYIDAWGIRWRYKKNAFGSFTEIIEHPLAGDKNKLAMYRIPDPKEDSQYEDFMDLKARYGQEKWMVGSSQISIFEACWYLRGFESFLLDMALDPDFCHALMDRVMEFPRKAARRYVDLGADMVWFGDDVAMQQGMIFSLEMWRTFLKPRYATLFSECKNRNPRIKIAYHSCGNCEAVIDDLIEIGLDVLNPIQPTAIDPFALKKRYGKRLVLFGCLCVQHVLPHGTPDEVASAAQRLQNECGAGGGYILSPAHHIQADTPLANIEAFYKTGLQQGPDAQGKGST
ncbi:MAG: uroporphyrinogen decarboxylase family protein [Planctomycetota bacterium]